jgi:hypothetical protein
MATITDHEAQQIDKANQTGRTSNPWTEAKVNSKSPDRRPLLIIKSGWREVADTALAFVKRFV